MKLGIAIGGIALVIALLIVGWTVPALLVMGALGIAAYVFIVRPNAKELRHIIWLGGVAFVEEVYYKETMTERSKARNSDKIEGTFYVHDGVIFFRNLSGVIIFTFEKNGYAPRAMKEVPDYLLNGTEEQAEKAFQTAIRCYPNEWKNFS